uniref:Uncharacterized protein n=1 Tax=Arundo donax TaxID=35708 RepID=A0A0A9DWP2_ARUDO
MDASCGAPPQEGRRDPHARVLGHHPPCQPRRLAGKPRLLQHQERRPEGGVQHPLDSLCHQGGAKNRLYRDWEAFVRPWQERPAYQLLHGSDATTRRPSTEPLGCP